MGFLNQLHLVFVTAWVLFLALGWVAMGFGTLRLAAYRTGSCIVLLGVCVANC